MWGDIIPPFDFDGQHFPGLNATPEGLAILANDCKLVTAGSGTRCPEGHRITLQQRHCGSAPAKGGGLLL